MSPGIGAETASPPVPKVELQGLLHHREGDLVPRNVFLAAQPHVETLLTRTELAVPHGAAEDHVDLIDLGQVDEGVELRDIHLGQGLFARLPGGALHGRLVVLQEAGGQGPEPVARLNGTAA